MLCALTVRKLTPGALEDFLKAFIPATAPPGWTRFYALRNVDDEDEVISFGFFDGTPEELRANHQQNAGDYEDRGRAADELVKSVGANGVTMCSRGAHSPRPRPRIRLTGYRIAQTRREHRRGPCVADGAASRSSPVAPLIASSARPPPNGGTVRLTA
jgi:hypothetical protein